MLETTNLADFKKASEEVNQAISVLSKEMNLIRHVFNDDCLDREEPHKKGTGLELAESVDLLLLNLSQNVRRQRKL